jgi:hypothetical protein
MMAGRHAAQTIVACGQQQQQQQPLQETVFKQLHSSKWLVCLACPKWRMQLGE